MSGAPPATLLNQSWEVVIGIVLVCLVASGFFSGAETGLMSTSRVRLRHRYGPGRDGRLGTLHALLERLESPILTCLFGTNLFNVLASAVMTVALTARFGERGQLYTVVVMSVLIILFGEILPKIVYREYPERLTLSAAPLIRASMVAISPLLWLLRGYAALWSRLLPPNREEESGALDRNTLSALLLADSRPRGHDQQFRHSLQRFLGLAKRDLGEIARPLARITSVPADATVATCLRTARESGFSRLPVLAGDGSLTGWIQVRDLLLASEGVTDETVLPADLVRTCLLVDERMSPLELFEELRGQRQELAVVTAAAGEQLGLVTLEDLVETIIGSIHDEFDRLPPGTEHSGVG
ncbi:MAG: CNNM domain-containing protein [bacterium]